MQKSLPMRRESMTMYAPPYAFRNTMHTRGTVAAAYACTSSAPWRIMPRHSRSRPGSKPGVSTNVTIGKFEVSHQATNRAALRDASMSIVPARYNGWFATTPTGRPSTVARAVTRLHAYSARTSKNESASTTSRITVRTSYDAEDRAGTVSAAVGQLRATGSSVAWRGGSAKW
jgi:hypothetical protein